MIKENEKLESKKNDLDSSLKENLEKKKELEKSVNQQKENLENMLQIINHNKIYTIKINATNDAINILQIILDYIDNYYDKADRYDELVMKEKENELLLKENDKIQEKINILNDKIKSASEDDTAINMFKELQNEIKIRDELLKKIQLLEDEKIDIENNNNDIDEEISNVLKEIEEYDKYKEQNVKNNKVNQKIEILINVNGKKYSLLVGVSTSCWVGFSINLKKPKW